MCRHVLNTRTMIHATCCGRWVECAEYDRESVEGEGGDGTGEMLPPHAFEVFSKSPKKQEEAGWDGSAVVTLLCKSCKRIFSKDLALFEKSDENCPVCREVFVLDAVTPESKLQCIGDQVFAKALGSLEESGKGITGRL